MNVCSGIRPVCHGGVQVMTTAPKENDMAQGTVKWFNATKGYGFIAPEDGGNDVFVHISAVQDAGLRGLNEGQRISYDIVESRGKESAGNLKVADAA